MVHLETTEMKDGAVTTMTKIDSPPYVVAVYHGLGLFYKLALIGIPVRGFVGMVRDDWNDSSGDRLGGVRIDEC